MTVAITRKDMTASELRAASTQTGDARAARRMLAIALVLEGVDRTTAARSCGMDRQTLRDWVHRYNADGVSGLSNHKAPGRQPRLSAPPETGTGCARRGRPRPRDRRRGAMAPGRSQAQDRSAVRDRDARAHGFQAARRARLRAAVSAPAASQGRPGGAGGVQKNFAERVTAVLPEHARGKPIEVWFQDEARVGQQGTLTRVWARRGTRPRGPRDRRYKWAYIFGAVCPARLATAALVLPKANAEAFASHLAEIGRQVAPGAHAILVLDGAGWHGADIEIPSNITLLALPPYSPELNPVENVWGYLRQNKLAISVFDSYRDILNTCCQAWNFFANDTAAVASITSRSWAQVNL